MSTALRFVTSFILYEFKKIKLDMIDQRADSAEKNGIRFDKSQNWKHDDWLEGRNNRDKYYQ